MVDYYDILGVDITATQKEITVAYRAACKRFHPDLNPGVDTTEKMQEVNEAYEVLSNNALRWQYDSQYGYSEESVEETCSEQGTSSSYETCSKES